MLKCLKCVSVCTMLLYFVGRRYDYVQIDVLVAYRVDIYTRFNTYNI
jgi:hypothetical protein